MSIPLPAGVRVFERGWLSANNVLFMGLEGSAVVDTGYVTHSEQTLALIGSALEGRELDHIVCTHLHSDHCGGNAALQAAYPGAWTRIPPGEFEAIQTWDHTRLTFEPTGQACPRFRADAVLRPGESIELADQSWQVHAAPGHDPHSVVLFEPGTRTLISADALWRRGFGIVFPELQGEAGFDEVAATLDLIESLAPTTVIPGHGSVFHGDTEVADSLRDARERLVVFSREPRRHAAYGIRALLKFKLLELQALPEADFLVWAEGTPYLAAAHARYFDDWPLREWLGHLVDQLVKQGAAGRDAGTLFNR